MNKLSKQYFYTMNQNGNIIVNTNIFNEVSTGGEISKHLYDFVSKLSILSSSTEEIADVIYSYDTEWIEYMVGCAVTIGNKELAQKIEFAKRINIVKKVTKFKLSYTMGEINDYMEKISNKCLKELAEELSASDDDLGNICVQVIIQELNDRKIKIKQENKTIKLVAVKK